jgi:hypothetical protein
LWFEYFNLPLDDLDHDWRKVLAILRDYFFTCRWFEVYDFVEFVAKHYDRYRFKEVFFDACNHVLEREVSAYRFVSGEIARITEQHEIDEIEHAMETARGPAGMHLQRALELLSSRDAPDYRNSIKESISAVEGLVATVLGAQGGTLGQMLKKLEDEIGLHGAIKNAFSSLYGYTSDEGGIRHALMELPTVKFEDAKFFLVVCSAFLNFVESKVSAPPA